MDSYMNPTLCLAQEFWIIFCTKMKTLAETILEIEALLDLAVANLSG